MSKKHFITLADMIRKARNSTDMFKNGEVLELAAFCKSQNCNFNRERWLDYIDGKCGPNGGPVKKQTAIAE
jgi:hypothetical protein